ncbi:MAG: hypothetical protein IPG07_09040 [Crocinitomicaceae bacterium]|jgi:hypothetical protein|nr:hypothetical protein [Crocinitomicaceae bacterium]MBK6953658.1 hypothetical protein [Crocinitomicaceae bacterium]
MKTKLLILGVGAMLILASCKKEGCTDEKAENYSKKAKTDDGSCVYADGVITQEITENITTATVIGDKTIKICGDIYISAGLTLSPGATVIMCAGASIHVEETGFISAVGTATNPIVIKGETETKGFWEGIAIYSNNPNNKFTYVTIKDAGTYWGWEYANVYLGDNAKLEMKNTTLSNSDNTGLYVSESATLVGFAQNTFATSITGLNISAKQVHMLDALSTYNSSNTNDFIFVRSGTITTEVTWPALSTPLLVNDVTVTGGLTLNAGVDILVEANGSFVIESTGYFKSMGTSTNFVNIHGRYNTSAFWDGILIDSNNPNNVFTYTMISDGGAYWGYEYANIKLNGSLSLDFSEVKNANSYGMVVANGATITTSGVVQTTAAGVTSNNSFPLNGSGPDADCTGGCTVLFL